MAFPVDAARAGTNGSTAAASKVCNLPTGIASNNRLVLILRSAGADTHSLPTGWNWLVQNNTADASDDTTSIIYRVADGAEGATVTVSGTASVKFAALCWRLTDAGTPQISAAATGASTIPDPPSFTPTGGAKDYLWLWAGGWAGEQTSPPAGSPTNYVNAAGADSGTAGVVTTNCRVAGASRQLNVATEDPPSWTISVSDNWSAWTVAVPRDPTRGLISFAELEVPFVLTRGLVSFAEFETPLAPTRGLVSFAEFETPLAPTRGQVSFGEFEVPSTGSPTRGLVSFAELEMPLTLRERCNAIMADIQTECVTDQPNYQTTNSIYFQGIRWSPTVPADGATVTPDNTVKPTDRPHNWNDAAITTPTASETQVAIHVYNGSQGQGYEIVGRYIEAGVTYRRVINIGPETYRERAWYAE